MQIIAFLSISFLVLRLSGNPGWLEEVGSQQASSSLQELTVRFALLLCPLLALNSVSSALVECLFRNEYSGLCAHTNAAVTSNSGY